MNRILPVLAALLAGGTAAGAAQGTEPLAPGQPAPGFALPGATREGALPGLVRLEDYRDKTVVIAFYYRARSRG